MSRGTAFKAVFVEERVWPELGWERSPSIGSSNLYTHTHTHVPIHVCVYICACTPLLSHTASSVASWMFQASRVSPSPIASPIASLRVPRPSSHAAFLSSNLSQSPRRATSPLLCPRSHGLHPPSAACCVCVSSPIPPASEWRALRCTDLLLPCSLSLHLDSKVHLLPRLQPGPPACDCTPTRFPATPPFPSGRRGEVQKGNGFR